jgi:hypothetical protein
MGACSHARRSRSAAVGQLGLNECAPRPSAARGPCRDDHAGLVPGRQSAEPGCHGTELLEPRQAPFDHVPAPADHLVKNRRPTALASSASAIGLGGRAPRFGGRDADRVWHRGEHRAVRATVESTDAVHSTTPYVSSRFREVTPWRTRTQAPQHPIRNLVVIPSGTPNTIALRKQRLYPRPCRVRYHSSPHHKIKYENAA